MSFILDALKKSENERQRQASPAMFEVRRAPPRNRLPVWAVIIGVLLMINLGVVAWLLIGGSSKREAADAAVAANTAVPSAPPQAAGPPPAAAPMNADPNTSGGGFIGNSYSPYVDPRVPSAQRAPPDVEPGENEPTLRDDAPEQDVLNPEDYEPAREAPNPPARVARQNVAEDGDAPAPPARGARASGVPTYQDVAAMPGMNVPPLRLDLHVYDPKPDARFVFLNMQKLKQGETLAQGGVHVDSITPEGAVLSFRGVRFLLTRE
jgi:general secretion pathway protein B